MTYSCGTGHWLSLRIEKFALEGKLLEHPTVVQHYHIDVQSCGIRRHSRFTAAGDYALKSVFVAPSDAKMAVVERLGPDGGSCICFSMTVNSYETYNLNITAKNISPSPPSEYCWDEKQVGELGFLGFLHLNYWLLLRLANLPRAS